VLLPVDRNQSNQATRIGCVAERLLVVPLRILDVCGVVLLFLVDF
jgi:hypothetical protein